MNIRFQPNTLYYGDCLDIMADFPAGCVDLICLDPPFNSNQKYHAIFRDSGLSIQPQIKASSTEGDLVLDPFAGCGTTIEAARINNRNAIGIDILPFALRLINQSRIQPHGIEPMPTEGVPMDYETAKALVKSDPYKFQDWAISLIDGLASNPQKSGDEGIDGFGVLHSDTLERKAIVVQVTGASGSQVAKYERLQTTIRNTNAAMGILITLDKQPSGRWTHNLEPVVMGQTQYPPIQCFSIQEYYRNGERYEPPLKLPPLANPWTGKPMQKTLFEAAQED